MHKIYSDIRKKGEILYVNEGEAKDACLISGQEDSLKEGMQPHSILACKISALTGRAWRGTVRGLKEVGHTGGN